MYINDLLIRSLAASCIHPRLRSVLFLNASLNDIQTAAERISLFLEAITQTSVQTTFLGSFLDEDDLWGFGYGLPNPWQRQGILLPSQNISEWRVIIIPDLSLIGRPAARAAVQLIEAEQYSFERHSQSFTFHSKLFWLSACSANYIGKVSRHVLDRFSLRFPRLINESNNRFKILEETLGLGSHHTLSEVFKTLLDSLKQPRCWPKLTDDAIDTALCYFEQQVIFGLRRHLALCRLATALAYLEKSESVMPSHVNEAALAIGLNHESQLSESQAKSLEVLEPEKKIEEYETPSSESSEKGDLNAVTLGRPKQPIGLAHFLDLRVRAQNPAILGIPM